MKKGSRWLAVTFAGLLAPLGLYLWPKDNANIINEPRRTAPVERRSLLQTVIATGVIRPVVGAEINVGSRISGTVVHLPVKIGDRVEAGQLLAELDSTALEAAREQARAELALALPRVRLAESTLHRRKRLAESGLETGEDLEIAQRDLEVERARLEASQASLRAAEIELGYTRITAPIGGVIAEVTTREGETVAANFSAPTFVTIVDLDRLEVLAYVDETDIGRVFVGQDASFSVDTYPDKEFSATVSAIQPKAELQGNVVNYVAKLGFDSCEGYVLRPEMTAHVQLLVEKRDEALTAPRGALRRRDGRPVVVVQRAGQWVEQEVKTGWRSDSSVEILSGLVEGETLALNPN
jgi:RND family efflux transporter MFP subunit